MKISIIVPVYNGENYIIKLFKSIETQEYNNYEIIFVNDGSTDKSIELLNKVKMNNNKIKIINQKNTGPGVARKNGFSQATGDLIFFVDCDDYLPNNTVLSDVVRIFKNNNPDIMFFDRNEFINGREEIIHFFDKNKISEGKHKISELPLMFIHAGLGSKIFKKDVLKEDMFPNLSNNEDAYTTYKYLDEVKTFYYCPKILYTIYHDDSNNSITKNLKPDHLIQSYDTFIELYDKIENPILKKSIIQIFPRLYIKYFLYKIKNKKISEALKLKMKDLKKFLKNNKIKYNPNGFVIIKKLFYRLILLF